MRKLSKDKRDKLLHDSAAFSDDLLGQATLSQIYKTPDMASENTVNNQPKKNRKPTKSTSPKRP